MSNKKPTLIAVTYAVRRLRLLGLIERIPKTHRYRLTAKGLRIAARPHDKGAG
jgi:predicted MarR family transcription regulator